MAIECLQCYRWFRSWRISDGPPDTASVEEIIAYDCWTEGVDKWCVHGHGGTEL